jgi:kynurenine formamidase
MRCLNSGESGRTRMEVRNSAPKKRHVDLPKMALHHDLDAPLPAYSALPWSEVLKARYCWGLFGENDHIGTMNLLTPARVKAALATVTEGRRINLSIPLDEPDPPPVGRDRLRHHIHSGNLNSLDDYVDNFYLQGSSQWDALKHIRAREFGFYNGYREEQVEQGPHLGIDHLARAGVIARGVLVDAAAYFNVIGSALEPSVGRPIHVQDLKAILAHQGSSLQPGDVLVLRTGWLGTFRSSSHDVRQKMMQTRAWPGLHSGEEMAEYLWDTHVAGVAADNRAVEMAPGDTAAGFLHRRVIALLGIHLAELWDLEELARACSARGRFEFLIASIPLNLPRGCGSPANAIAIV